MIRLLLILVGVTTWAWALMTPGFNGWDILGMLAWVMVVALVLTWPSSGKYDR